MIKETANQQVTPQQVFELLLPLTAAEQRNFIAELEGRFREYYRKAIEEREVELNEAHKRAEIFNQVEVPGQIPLARDPHAWKEQTQNFKQ
jgi:hypothetical protein